jgi:hypothetical protein
MNGYNMKTTLKVAVLLGSMCFAGQSMQKRRHRLR